MATTSKTETAKGKSYMVNTKEGCFSVRNQSIVYPFVNFIKNSKGKGKTVFLSNEDYCDVLYFIEETKMSTIISSV